MTTYNVEIVINGRDNASNALGNIGRGLSGIAQIAGGILTAGLFTRLASGIAQLGSVAFESTGNFQALGLQLTSLVAREINASGETNTLSEALAIAEPIAAQLRDRLADIAIQSPYRNNVVQDTFRLGMTFGFTRDQSVSFTKSLLNVAAGSGMTNDMLSRTAYNLAQVRLQGKVTAVDIRQLALAGFDLRSVLKSIGEQFGVTINDHLDFNKAIESGKLTWEQFSLGFEKYADENFGEASKRMSLTLIGLKSSFQDLFELTIPRILEPTAKIVSGLFGGWIADFQKFRNSPALDQIGQKLADGFQGWIDKFNTLKAVFSGGFGADTQAFTLSKIFNIPESVSSLIIKIKDDILLFVDSLKSAGPTLQEIGQGIGDALLKAFEWLDTNYEDVKAALLGIGAALLVFQAPAVIAALEAIGAAIAAINWPLVAIAAAVGLLVAAWQGNWGGMRDTLTQVWTGTLQPALQELWNWLSINVPAALQTLSDFWTVTLLPAIQSVWGWMNTVLFPFFSAFGLLISTVVNTLIIPAFTALWSFISTLFAPVIQALNAHFGNTGIQLSQVGEYITGTLVPGAMTILKMSIEGWTMALQDATKWINSAKTFLEGLGIKILAIRTFFDLLKDSVVALGLQFKNQLELKTAVIKTNFQYLYEAGVKVYEFFKSKFQGAVTNLGQAFSKVLSTIEKLADLLGSLTLPSWLTPGSPTPLELGLRGIERAMSSLNGKAFGGFISNTALLPASVGIDGGNSTVMSNSNTRSTVVNLYVNNPNQSSSSILDDVRTLQVLLGAL